MSQIGNYPVQNHYNNFLINKDGVDGEDTSFVKIAGIETFDMSFDKTTQEDKGWENDGFFGSEVTGIKVTFSLSGKRKYGDEGNDYIASTAWLIGNKTRSKAKWVLPTGQVVTFPVIVVAKKIAGGSSEDVDALEVELIMNGKPTIVDGEQNAEG